MDYNFAGFALGGFKFIIVFNGKRKNRTNHQYKARDKRRRRTETRARHLIYDYHFVISFLHGFVHFGDLAIYPKRRGLAGSRNFYRRQRGNRDFYFC